MSEQQTKQARPAQVTAAGLIVMLGSVFVVLLIWDRVSHLNTAATQTSLQTFLNRSKLDDDGVDAHTMTTVVKVVSMVCAALAVATAVQGYQVSRRSRGARLAVSVLAVPLFVTALVGDGFVGSAAATFWCSGVAAAALTLWLGPARAWFGDPTPTLRRAPDQLPAPPVPGTSPVPAPTASWTPPPTSAYDVRRAAGARPRALLWACVVTWVSTGLSALGLGLSLAVLVTDSGSVLNEVYRQNPHLADQGLSEHAVRMMLMVICGVVLAAAVAAAVFALLLFQRRPWAWYALVVSAAAAALLFLIAAFGSPVAIVLLGACVATIVCLVRPEVRAWAVGHRS